MNRNSGYKGTDKASRISRNMPRKDAELLIKRANAPRRTAKNSSIAKAKTTTTINWLRSRKPKAAYLRPYPTEHFTIASITID